MPTEAATTTQIMRSSGGTRERRSVTPLLRLLHLASPALPIGGFHFSQGLEYAVTRGWVRDEQTAADWISGVANDAIGRLDLPILLRLYRAHGSASQTDLVHWNDWLVASRETAELRAEDLHMGSALAKVLTEHALDFGALEIERPAYATVFSFACQRWGATAPDTLTAYAWTWLENQVLAAIKLVPLGQMAGQRILHATTQIIPQLCARAEESVDDEIGIATLIQGLASALHESQYTRLFRS